MISHAITTPIHLRYMYIYICMLQTGRLWSRFLSDQVANYMGFPREVSSTTIQVSLSIFIMPGHACATEFGFFMFLFDISIYPFSFSSGRDRCDLLMDLFVCLLPSLPCLFLLFFLSDLYKQRLLFPSLPFRS